MRPDGPGAIRRVAREVGMVLGDAAVVNRFGNAGVVEVGDGQPVAVRVEQLIADLQMPRRRPTLAFGPKRMLRRRLENPRRATPPPAQMNMPQDRLGVEDFLNELERRRPVGIVLVAGQDFIARPEFVPTHPAALGDDLHVAGKAGLREVAGAEDGEGGVDRAADVVAVGKGLDRTDDGAGVVHRPHDAAVGGKGSHAARDHADGDGAENAAGGPAAGRLDGAKPGLAFLAEEVIGGPAHDARRDAGGQAIQGAEYPGGLSKATFTLVT